MGFFVLILKSSPEAELVAEGRLKKIPKIININVDMYLALIIESENHIDEKKERLMSCKLLILTSTIFYCW